MGTTDEVLEKEGSPTPSQPVVEMAQVEDTDSYLDIDTVQLLDEDFQIITNIRKLSDTTRDKLVFTIFTVNIMLTGFMVGYIPQYYYIAYTFKAVLLIGYRWYFYKKINSHYFLLDFCYFTTFLILVYLWLPCCDTFRGALYPIIFGFSNGPLLAAVALWRNSIVPHSLDKMTSVFIHISPAVTLWGIRWYTLEEQRFPLCANPTVPGPDGCNHVDSGELLFYPMFMYLIWQMVYAIVVYFWRKERVERKNYETSYKLLVEKSRNSTLYQWCSVFGIKYGKLLFAAYQFVYTLVSMLLAYPCFHYIYTNMILVVIVLVVASYNGASFYIDVFSQRYRNNKDK